MTLRRTAYASVETAQQLEQHQQQDLDLLQSNRPGYGTRSTLEVSFNIVNATVGAGVIGLPLTLLWAGFINGIVLSAIVAFMSYSAIYGMVLAGKHVGVYKFASLGEHILGRVGFNLINLMLFIQSSGCCISYFILVADTIPVLCGLYLPQYTILANRTISTLLISILIIFPLNLPRSIGALASWSTVSVLLLPIMILSILIRAPAYAKLHEAPISWLGEDPVSALGILSFAFVCSQVAFSNYLSQRNQSVTAWSITSALSSFMSWSISITFAVIGYLCFGKDVQSNLFANFPVDDHVINVGRLALGLSMVLTVPMAFYPARDAMQKALGFETSDRQPNAVQHYTVTVMLFAALLALGVHVRSLGKVYSLVGGIASSCLAYLMPGLAYIGAFHPTWLPRLFFSTAERQPLLLAQDATAKDANELLKPKRWLDIVSIVLVIFGSALMVLTAIKAFQ